jgi:hypothetical protein
MGSGWKARTRRVCGLSVSLEKLPAGSYDLQVTVLDPTGQKAAFWQAPIVLVP